MRNILEPHLVTKRLLYICLLIIGVILAFVGIIFDPSFISRYLSSDGILGKSTIVRIYILEALTIALGFCICLYSLLKITRSVFAEKIDEKLERYIILPWNRYWFNPTSLRRLAIFRILIFSFLICNALFIWIPSYIEHLKGVSLEFFEPLLLIRVLHLSPPSSPFVLDIIHFLLVLFAVGAAIGFMTRFSIFGSLVLYLYIVGVWWSFEGIHRSEAPPFIFAMAALLLSPCGKFLSVDEVLARMRASKKRGEFQRDRTEELESEHALWPIRLTQVSITFSYFNAGYWKLKMAGLSWADGTTLQFHLIDHNLRGHNITDFGLFLSQFPLLCKVLSISTLIFELGFPLILFFPRLAWILLPAGVFFHIGTGITMDTWFYPLWFSYIAFINFEAFGVWFKGRFKFPYNTREVKVFYDGACPICIRSMTLVAYFDWLKRIEFVDLRNWKEISRSYLSLNKEDCLGEMHVIDQSSQAYKGFFAYRRLARVIPIFWLLLPFLYLPGIPLVGDWTYHWIANRRARNAVACTIHNCK